MAENKNVGMNLGTLILELMNLQRMFGDNATVAVLVAGNKVGLLSVVPDNGGATIYTVDDGE